MSWRSLWSRARRSGNPLVLETPRLTLVAATPKLLRAELDGHRRLGRLLEAEIPESWPPPLTDDRSMRWNLSYLDANPDAVGWAMWYFLRREEKGRRAVGCGGFKGVPEPDGTVEIGYTITEEDQRQGYAPEATRALVDWAFDHAEIARVTAHAPPDLRPSIRVLEKCGFSFAGEGREKGAVLFELRREDAPRGRVAEPDP